MQSDPLYTLNVGHSFYEFGNVLTTVQINAVVGQLLGDNLQLSYSLTNQPAHLIEYLVHRSAPVAARNDRNGAVSTMPVAPF